MYSLGAILYHLLAGVPPHRLDGASRGDWERAICEAPVPPPSAAAPPLRRKPLRGDLDNIVLMALRKDPARRYASIEHFADDLRSFLACRPVSARRDSLAYRASKFVRRHRLPVAAAVLAAAGLSAAILVALSQARRANERTAQIVELSNHSLSNVYALLEHLPGAVSARKELVNTTLAYLEKVSADTAQNEDARTAVATAYLRLGDVQGNPDAASLRDMTGALKTYRAGSALIDPAGPTPSGPRRLALWLDLQQRIGAILSESGATRESVAVLDRAARLAAAEPAVAADPKLRRRENALYLALARAFQQSDSQRALEYAERHLARATELAKAFPADADFEYDLSLGHTQIGYLLIGRRDLDAAVPHYERSIALRENLVRRDPENATYRRILMLAYEHFAALQGGPLVANLGNPEFARRYYAKARVLEERAVADPSNLLARYDYANFLLRSSIVETAREALPGAIAALEKAAAMLEEFSAADPGIARYRHELANCYEFLGRQRLAAGQARAALSDFRRASALDRELVSRFPKDRDRLIRGFSADSGIVAALAGLKDRGAAVAAAQSLVTAAAAAVEHSSEKDLLRPALAQAQLALASAHRQFGEWRQARAAAAQAIALLRPLLTGRGHDPNARVLHDAGALVAECDARLGR